MKMREGILLKIATVLAIAFIATLLLILQKPQEKSSRDYYEKPFITKVKVKSGKVAVQSRIFETVELGKGDEAVVGPKK